MDTSLQSPRYAISGATKADRTVDISWGDAHLSRFHFIWLRDNCECPECGHGWGKKFVKVIDIPTNVSPEQVRVVDHNNLELTWSGGHVSTYSSTWLRDHCYSGQERARRRHQPILWDSTLTANLPCLEFNDVESSKQGILAMLEQARDYGFSVVRHMPVEPGMAERLGSLIGPLRENNYGRVFEVQAGVGPDIAATQNYAIEPHCDDGFRYNPPGLTVFHCLQNVPGKGGETWMTDCFSVAKALREDDREAFEILSQAPQVRRRWHKDEADLRTDCRVISLDFDGAVVGVRFAANTSAPLDLPFDWVEPYYAALRRFITLGLDERFRVEFKLEPGDGLVFDNHRVTYGRAAFSGQRHLQLVHIDREDFHSRLRVLSQQLGRDGADQVLPRGALM